MRPGLHACRLPNHRESSVVGQFRRRGRARHHVVGTGSGSTMPSVAGWDREGAMGRGLPCLAGKAVRLRVAIGAQTYDGVGPMGDASIHSIRIAGPADSGIDLLGRALPFMTSANPILLASGTYYIAEREPGHLVGCGGWTAARPGSGEIIEAEAHIRHFATHPRWGEELGPPCLRVASATPANAASDSCTAFRHGTLSGSIRPPVSRRSGRLTCRWGQA
jgi:hypothetical protein